MTALTAAQRTQPCPGCGHPLAASHGLVATEDGTVCVTRAHCRRGDCDCILDTATGLPLGAPDIDVTAALADVAAAEAALATARARLADFVRRDVEPSWGLFMHQAYATLEPGARPWSYPLPMTLISYGFTVTAEGIAFSGSEYEHGSTIEYDYFVPADFVDPATRDAAKARILAEFAAANDRLRADQEKAAERKRAAVLAEAEALGLSLSESEK